MVSIRITRDEYGVRLTYGYLPDMSRIEERLAMPYERRCPKDERSFACRDCATAWLLSTRARKYAFGFSEEKARSFDFRTWVLNQPKAQEGRLSGWFENHNDDNYRLFLHAFKKHAFGKDLCIHPYAYAQIGISQGIRSYKHLIGKTRYIVRAIAKSLCDGEQQLWETIGLLNHPFCYSEGWPNARVGRTRECCHHMTPSASSSSS